MGPHAQRKKTVDWLVLDPAAATATLVVVVVGEVRFLSQWWVGWLVVGGACDSSNALLRLRRSKRCATCWFNWCCCHKPTARVGAVDALCTWCTLRPAHLDSIL